LCRQSLVWCSPPSYSSVRSLALRTYTRCDKHLDMYCMLTLAVEQEKEKCHVKSMLLSA
jgi:hypothetical protein